MDVTQAVHPPREGEGEPWRCLYFMGLRPRPAPVVPGQRKAPVNLNTPVAEFRNQVRARGCCCWPPAGCVLLCVGLSTLPLSAYPRSGLLFRPQ